MPRLEVPESSERAAGRVLQQDEPCVVITTVHKFADAGHLNDRAEHHRARRRGPPHPGGQVRQGVARGRAEREVLRRDRHARSRTASSPPSSLFGDPDDPDFIMSRYTPEQSIARRLHQAGRSSRAAPSASTSTRTTSTRPSTNSPRTRASTRTRRSSCPTEASHIETVLSNPERIDAVCADIVEHYLTYVAPLGQKAQVVAYNQDLVVAYAERIEAELQRLGDRAALPSADGTPGATREVAVVMHVVDSKDTPAHLQEVHPDRRAGRGTEAALQEGRRPAVVRRRHREVDDRLQRPHRGRPVPRQAAEGREPVPDDHPARTGRGRTRSPASARSSAASSTTSGSRRPSARRSSALRPAATRRPRRGQRHRHRAAGRQVRQELTHMLTRCRRHRHVRRSLDALAERTERIPDDTDAAQRLHRGLRRAPDASGSSSTRTRCSPVQVAVPVAREGLRVHPAARRLQGRSCGRSRREDHGPDPRAHDRRPRASRRRPQRHPRRRRHAEGQEDREQPAHRPAAGRPKQPGDVFQEVLDSIEARLRRLRRHHARSTRASRSASRSCGPRRSTTSRSRSPSWSRPWQSPRTSSPPTGPQTETIGVVDHPVRRRPHPDRRGEHPARACTRSCPTSSSASTPSSSRSSTAAGPSRRGRQEGPPRTAEGAEGLQPRGRPGPVRQDLRVRAGELLNDRCRVAPDNHSPAGDRG